MGQAPKGDTYNTDGEGYPLIAGAGDFDKKGGISVSKFTTAPTRLSEPGDIIMSIRASIGATVWADKIYCLGRGVAGLRPGPELDSQFLWYWLPTVEKLLLSKARGATFVQVNRKDVEELPIELPPLDEQRKFAEEHHLKFLIQQKRERQQELFEELKSSLFQSMLDDDNETVNLGDVASFIGGSSLPTGEPFTGQEGGVLLMKVSDMNAPGNKNKIHHTSLWVSKHGNENQIVPAGSVVIPKRGASIATNKKRLITRPTALDPNLMAITPKSEKLTSQFLYHWFLQFDLTSITSGSSVPQLNKKDLSPLEISIPSFQHQINFARIIDTIKY